MDWSEIFKLIEAQTNRQLRETEKAILIGSWEDKTYKEISDKGYTEGHLKDIGTELWQLLSNFWGVTITKKNFKTEFKQYLLNQGFPIPNDQDWGGAPDVPVFFGRSEEIKTLQKWIIKDKCRLLGILGIGGIGKTNLSVKLGKGGIGKTDLSLKLARGIEGHFEYVIWRQLLNAPSVNEIITDLIKFFSDQRETKLPKTINEQINLLLNYLDKHRCLVILDNVESILQSGDEAGKYRDGYEEYGQLFKAVAEVNHKSCLLITSREKPSDFAFLKSPSSPVRLLELNGLNYIDGQKIFQELGEFSGTDEEWQRLNEFYNGNPLALKLAARHIKEVFNGSIAKFLNIGKPIFNDIRELLTWHFQRLSDAEKEIIYWLAINRELTSIKQLQEDILSPSAYDDVPSSLQSLQRRLPLETNDGYFTLQPVLIEYATEQLIKQVFEEIRIGQFQILDQFPLVKALGKDYIREAQVRVIVEPIKEQLIYSFGSKRLLVHLQKILEKWQIELEAPSGYAVGNLLNLLCLLRTDLRNFNFSSLVIRQAYLQGMNLSGVNFADAEFINSAFTQSFGGVGAIAFSLDGQFLAVGESQGEIRLLRIKDGQQVRKFVGHQWWISSLAFSPNGEYLVSSSFDRTVKLWSVKTGQLIYTFKGHTQWVWKVVFSPDGQTIASGSDDNKIKLWCVNTGNCLRTLEGHHYWVWSVAFSPDGQKLASGSYDRTIKIWDVNTSDCLQTWQAHEEPIWTIGFSPDGKKLASAGCDKTIKIWNSESEECLKTILAHKKEITHIVFGNDGKTLVSGSFEGNIKVWNADTGECLHTMDGHLTGIYSLALSPDCRRVASGDIDQVLKLWSTKTGKCLKTWMGYTDWIWSVALSPDSQIVASGNLDHTIKLWDVSTGSYLKTLKGHQAWIHAVTFSLNGQFLASGSDDETVRIWDTNTGECLQVLTDVFDTYQGGTWTVAFTPDSQYLASAGQARDIKLWDMRTGKLKRILLGHSQWVLSVVFSPNGQILASGSDDKTIKIWDWMTGQLLKTFEGHTGKVKSITFSPDSQLLISASEDYSLKIWDLTLGECLNTIETHTGLVPTVASSPDGQYLASSAENSTIRLWDSKTLECLMILPGHTHAIKSFAFSRDSQTLISSSIGRTIKFWRVKTGECFKTWQSLRPYEGMNITGIKGLTSSEKLMLQDLGAISVD